MKLYYLKSISYYLSVVFKSLFSNQYIYCNKLKMFLLKYVILVEAKVHWLHCIEILEWIYKCKIKENWNIHIKIFYTSTVSCYFRKMSIIDRCVYTYKYTRNSCNLNIYIYLMNKAPQNCFEPKFHAKLSDFYLIFFLPF